MSTTTRLPDDLSLATAMQQLAQYRARHWDALVRAVLAVRAPDVDAQGAIAWDRVSREGLELAVTRDDVRAWLATQPPRACVRVLGWLCDLRDPRAVTREDLVRMAAELHPDALLEILGGSWPNDPLAQGLHRAAGVAFGEAAGRALLAAPYSGFAPAMRLATDEACAAYLRIGAPAISPHELGQVAHHLLLRDSVSDAVRAAYGTALVSVAERITQKQAADLYVFSTLASAADLEATLRASAKKPKVWTRLVALLVAQGAPQGAAALAAMLEDKKLAGHAAVALAVMGRAGAAAARAWLDAHAGGGTKLAPGISAARKLLAIPESEPALWAGEQYSLPRFGRAPSEDELDGALEVSGPPAHAPTPLASLESMLTERPVADLLSREGWADLLQIVALDPFLSNVSHAWQRASEAGLLGRGNDPAAMIRALDRMHWDAVITKHYPAHKHGVGLALIWAGASRDVYAHAIARFEESGAGHVLGARERHFVDPLEVARPSWAPTIRCLLRHYGARRDETAWLGAPPLLTELGTAAASVELAAPSTDLWISGEARGARRFTITFRDSVQVTVDVEAEAWTVSGPTSASGSTPPLRASRGVRFTIETARDTMYLGIDGAVLHGAISKLPARVAPVRVVAEGEHALVTRLTLHAKYTVRAAEAAGVMLLDLDGAQGYVEVAGLCSAPAARALAACAVLLEAPRADLAKDALLAMPSDELEPWKTIAREGVAIEPVADAPRGAAAKAPRKKKVAPAEAAVADGGTGTGTDETESALTRVSTTTPVEALAPAEFTVRSFEDVVRVFHDAKLGVKARGKKPVELKRGQTAQGDLEYVSFAPKPETEDWGARTAVPWPAIYLGEHGPSFAEPEYFVDAIADLPAVCQKGRGTSAEVSYVAREGSFLVASMLVEPPDNGDDWQSWQVAAAAWKVDEGWCWAVMEGVADKLLPLLHLRALPPQLEWKQTRKALGNW